MRPGDLGSRGAQPRALRAAFLAAVLASAAALGGCGGDDDPGQGSQPVPSGQPDRIVVAAGLPPKTLDPVLAETASERLIASAIQTPLLTFRRGTGDNAATLEPALAMSLPRLAEKRLEYRFTLRPGLVYADGRLVKASDVERAIAHASKVATDPELRGVLRGVVGAPSADGETLRGVRTDDRNGVVVVRLRRPDGRLPLALASPATAPQPEVPSTDPKALPASTGPLRVARVTGDSVELVANPLRAKIDTVPAARTAQISVLGRFARPRELANGTVGVGLAVDAVAWPTTRVVPESTTVNATAGAVWALLVSSTGAFAERPVREALAEAVDRRELDTAPGYRAACGLLPAWVVGAVQRDDCPPVPVTSSRAPLLGQRIRLAEPPQGLIAEVPATSEGATNATTPTTPATKPATPSSVATRALASLGGVVSSRTGGAAPERRLAQGLADAALVRIEPTLPYPGGFLEPVAPLDALVERTLPALSARPLTGSAGAWSALERRVVARAVAIPLANEVNSAAVGRSVEPRSVVMHPVLGLDLAALRLR